MKMKWILYPTHSSRSIYLLKLIHHFEFLKKKKFPDVGYFSMKLFSVKFAELEKINFIEENEIIFFNWYLCLSMNDFIIYFFYRIKKQPQTAMEGGGVTLYTNIHLSVIFFKPLLSILSNYLLWLSYSSHQSHTPYTPGGKKL